MSLHDINLHSAMPKPAPMAMPTQDLARAPDRSGSAPKPVPGTNLYRWLTFIPAFVTVAILVAIFSDWFSKGGFQISEIVLLALVAISSFWIALSVSTSTIGLLRPNRRPASPSALPLKALDVALLVPVYNESPKSVFARIRAMQSEVARADTHHRFAFFVLSDTRCDDIAEQEWAEFQKLTGRPSSSLPIFYRRRADNVERKTGNIRNWVESWGGAWDAFVTLDADSLMSASSLVGLANQMAERPDAGLIQTVPKLQGAESWFGRVQQFSNNVYGDVLAFGLERWCGNEGNYWGHNAIIRTRAFAESAGLPSLKGKGALSGTIKSHDFVEAALLRRAGWAVELRPTLAESYEETPQNIIDYVLRDRRWCQGNLQHLRLLGTRGLAAASRFHMLQGAMAYIASLVWFALLVLFTLMGKSEEETVFRYFTDANPLFPQWPETDAVSRTVVLCFVIGLLLLPKLFALAQKAAADPSLKNFGGPLRFALSATAEIGLSFLLAPILMIQHVVAIARTVANMDTGWAPQNRSGGSYPLRTLMRFHAVETTVGILLLTAIVLDIASLWLVPIAISLLFAVPLSWAVGRHVARSSAAAFLMKTAEDVNPPRIIRLVDGAQADELHSGEAASFENKGARQPA